MIGRRAFLRALGLGAATAPAIAAAVVTQREADKPLLLARVPPCTPETTRACIADVLGEHGHPVVVLDDGIEVVSVPLWGGFRGQAHGERVALNSAGEAIRVLGAADPFGTIEQINDDGTAWMRLG